MITYERHIEPTSNGSWDFDSVRMIISHITPVP